MFCVTTDQQVRGSTPLGCTIFYKVFVTSASADKVAVVQFVVHYWKTPASKFQLQIVTKRKMQHEKRNHSRQRNASRSPVPIR